MVQFKEDTNNFYGIYSCTVEINWYLATGDLCAKSFVKALGLPLFSSHSIALRFDLGLVIKFVRQLMHFEKKRK